MVNGLCHLAEARQDLGLSLEPGEAVRVAGERLGKGLERDRAVELGVGGLVRLDLSLRP